MKKYYGLLFFLLIFLFSSPALAKKKPKAPPKAETPPPVEENMFTPEQLVYNAQAAEATQNGEFEKAEKIFLANIQVKEFDITWLNLGRTYARQMKCFEARDAYQHVRAAPHAADMDRASIEETLERFEKELNEACALPFARAEAAKDGGYFTDEQITLNNKASEATNAGDYDKAELLYRANLRLREFDITWLNLGRTYAKHGNCIEARDAYSHVLEAPVLRDTANMNIEGKLSGFQEELFAECEDQFRMYDTWHEVSLAYNISGWSLLGIGVAGIVAGVVMFSINKPLDTSPYDDLLNKEEDIYNSYITSEGRNYLEENQKYTTQVLILKSTVLGVGLAAAVTGSVLLVVDYLKFGGWKWAEKMKESGEAERQERQLLEEEFGVDISADESGTEAGLRRFDWMPSIVVDPLYMGVGFTGRF